jgi:rhodanese-related sulfurtransferase
MKISTTTFSIAALLVVLVYFAYQYAVDSPHRIPAETGKALLKDKKIDVLLDVRTDLERKTLGFYPGSVHIQSADLDQRMPREYPDKSIRILAYCNTGHRARMATDKLHKLGYKNAVYISSSYKTLL